MRSAEGAEEVPSRPQGAGSQWGFSRLLSLLKSSAAEEPGLEDGTRKRPELPPEHLVSYQDPP